MNWVWPCPKDREEKDKFPLCLLDLFSPFQLLCTSFRLWVLKETSLRALQILLSSIEMTITSWNWQDVHQFLPSLLPLTSPIKAPGYYYFSCSFLSLLCLKSFLAARPLGQKCLQFVLSVLELVEVKTNMDHFPTASESLGIENNSKAEMSLVCYPLTNLNRWCWRVVTTHISSYWG